MAALHPERARAVYGFLRGNLAQILMLAAVAVLMLLFTPQFFNVHNLTAVARQSSSAGIAALGMTFVVLTGGIDMSVGSVIAMSGIVFAGLARSGADPALCTVFSLLAGAAVGLVNAFGILFCGMQPFIMTIATASVTAGAAHLLCGGIPVGISNVGGGLVEFLGVGSAAGIPTVFLLMIILAVIFQVILRYLPFGRFVYSVGSSFEGARLAGVRTMRISTITYILCSVCAALVGVINVCTYKAGYPSLGSEAALDSIAAIVIGGASLAGGKGTVTGTVVGVLLLTVAANILGLVGVSTYMQQIVKGVIIIAAILHSTKGLGNRFRHAWRQL
jgi:ribose transport system permease protein